MYIWKIMPYQKDYGTYIFWQYSKAEYIINGTNPKYFWVFEFQIISITTSSPSKANKETGFQLRLVEM